MPLISRTCSSPRRSSTARAACSFWLLLITDFFFFFSSRRRHTRYWRDWSSDVCSSDLLCRAQELSRCEVVSPPQALVVKYFDRLETRSPRAREAALMAALPRHIAHAKQIGRASCRERV